GMLCMVLGWVGRQWTQAAASSARAAGLPLGISDLPDQNIQAGVELLKLLAAALVGCVITAVHRLHPGDKPLSRSLQQAQILMCVCGAMMMIIIGNSLVRALGIAGGASIIRFRTPVEDPKDTTVLFLLLGLGMACGLGAFGVAGLGTMFLGIFLLVLDRFGERKPRNMMLELVARGPEFPSNQVDGILRRCGVQYFEPRAVSNGDHATIKYHVKLEPGMSLEHLSAELMNGGTTSGLKSVAWQAAKKRA
ncbi:MAG: hypothetical protein ACRD1T_16735, partial [Acidimicrobiia bacterium]